MKAPLRKVVERTQSFQSTEDYPDGWIEEKLECGHVRIEGINLDWDEAELAHVKSEVEDGLKPVFRHNVNAQSRRCKECATCSLSKTKPASVMGSSRK